MATPYSTNLNWEVYQINPNWHLNIAKPIPKVDTRQTEQAVREVFNQTFKEPIVQGVQFIRDLARLVLKVPIRLICTHTWESSEHAAINAKLAGYSLVRVLFVPVKLIIAINALFTSIFSKPSAQRQLDLNNQVTGFLNGRASQLEALKEQGLKNADFKAEYQAYKEWIYTINPELCR